MDTRVVREHILTPLLSGRGDVVRGYAEACNDVSPYSGFFQDFSAHGLVRRLA